MNDLDNIVYFDNEAQFGMRRAHVVVWTNIANNKRCKLFAELACKQLTDLEQIVKAMPYDDVVKMLESEKQNEKEIPSGGLIRSGLGYGRRSNIRSGHGSNDELCPSTQDIGTIQLNSPPTPIELTSNATV